MERPFYTLAVRVVLPPILGALGALMAATAPAYYMAVCQSPMVPLLSVTP